MTDQLLSELRKIRSTRTNLALLAGMVSLILLAVLIGGLTADRTQLGGHDQQHSVLSAGTQAALFAALIGVMAITSEFRHGTIRPTFVVTPRRGRVVTAKLVSSLVMGVLFGIAGIALSFGIGYAILALRGVDLALGSNHVLLMVFGTVAVTGLWATLGAGFGAVVRNQVFAIIALIVWTGFVDPILGSLVPGVGRFSPIAASGALVADPQDYLLTPLAGGLLLIGYMAAFVVAGYLVVARRDVT